MRAACHRAQRGTIAVIFALTLTVLLGSLALAVDVGDVLNVRAELQNAADAAALAGARDLNGSVEQYAAARLSAQYFGAQHSARGKDVDLDLNFSNSADGNVVLGHWDGVAKTFTVAGAAMPPAMVNAVQVTARRVAGEGGPVGHFFAPLLGTPTSDVTASAVAVAGSPASTCGFPLVVSDCSILDQDGDVKCNQELVFSDAKSDNVGFTLLSGDNPNTQAIKCMMGRAMGQCPSKCGSLKNFDCSTTCNATGIDDEIRISNGNNLNDELVETINRGIGPGGFTARVPVVESGLSPAQCGSFQYNRLHRVVGYVTLKITKAQSKPRMIKSQIQCGFEEASTPGGNLYETSGNNVYLVR